MRRFSRDGMKVSLFLRTLMPEKFVPMMTASSYQCSCADTECDGFDCGSEALMLSMERL